MIDWFVNVLRSYPELAVFLSIGIGFLVGPWKLFGFSLGTVTATLLAAVVIGQVHIEVDSAVKSTFFIMFIFAVGYGVGPQFIRGLKADGAREVLFALSVLALCLIVPVVAAKIAGLELGFAAGLYAGSQTISAAIGVATDQINQLGLSSEQAQTYANQIPIAYAVTYIYGDHRLGHHSGQDRAASDRRRSGRRLQGIRGQAGRRCGRGHGRGDRFGLSRHRIPRLRDPRGQRFARANPSKTLCPASASMPSGSNVADQIVEVEDDTILQAGDTVMFSGRRADLVGLLEAKLKEADAPELLSIPSEKLDVLITNKEVHGKTLEGVGQAVYGARRLCLEADAQHG